MKIFLCFVAFFPVISHAAYTVKDGNLIAVHEMATLSVQEHYSLVQEAFEADLWDEVIEQGKIIIKNFPKTPFAHDSEYFLGVAYFKKKEFSIANKFFSKYLDRKLSTKFFEKVVRYKFAIAENFRGGEKRRLFNKEALPKWLPSKQEAIEIYNEVAAAMPQDELAVKALYAKAELQFLLKEYAESIESFEVVIRRFPTHPLACESFVAIAKVYCAQADQEYPDPDYLDLASMNSKKFQAQFPRHPKQKEVDQVYLDMLEVYARELYETAKFYERTNKPNASLLYYAKILEKYPGTKHSAYAKKKLEEAGHTPTPSVIKHPNSIIVDGIEESGTQESIR